MKKTATKVLVLLLTLTCVLAPLHVCAEGVTKTSTWTNDEKNDMEIIIEIPKMEEMPVFFIGSNCNGHTLTADAIYASLNKIAEYNNVDYVLHSLVSVENSCVNANRANTERVASGAVAKGTTLTSTQKSGISGSLVGGGHNSVVCFAREICDYLSRKTYSQVVMEFDSNYIFTGTNLPVNAEEKKILHRAAELLAPYYADNRVIWLTPSPVTSISYIINPPTYVTVPNTAPENALPLHEGCYTSSAALMTANFDLETAAPVLGMTDWNKKLGLYDRYNMFFGMALFDPQTWLTAVDANGEMIPDQVPEWSEYTINSNFVFYNNRAQIIEYLNDALVYDTVQVEDTVAPNLEVEGAVLEVCRSTGIWTPVTSGAIVSGNGVSASASGEDIRFPLRLRITAHCNGSFHDNHEPAATNVGEAVVHLMYRGTEAARFSLLSPKLLKDSKPVLSSSNLTVPNGTSLEELVNALGITATDAEDGNLASSAIISSAIGYDPIAGGEFPVVVSVTDSDGNTVDLSLTVTVETNEKPVLSAANVVVPYGTSFEDAVAAVGASATDLEDGDLTSQIVASGAVEYHPDQSGDYSVVLSVTDSDGNTVSTEIHIQVEESPVTGDAILLYVLGAVCSITVIAFLCLKARKKPTDE